MFFFLLILFTVIPAIEIYLLFTIGAKIGGMNTLFVVIATGILGATLAKSQGLSILNRMQVNLAKGEVPADQFIHGLLVFGGGLLLLTPGFLTDVLGLSMVMPGTRNMIAHFMKSFFHKYVQTGGNGAFFTSTNMNSSSFDFKGQDTPKADEEIGPGVFEAEFRETKSQDEPKE